MTANTQPRETPLSQTPTASSQQKGSVLALETVNISLHPAGARAASGIGNRTLPDLPLAGGITPATKAEGPLCPKGVPHSRRCWELSSNSRMELPDGTAWKALHGAATCIRVPEEGFGVQHKRLDPLALNPTQPTTIITTAAAAVNASCRTHHACSQPRVSHIHRSPGPGLQNSLIASSLSPSLPAGRAPCS